MTKQPNEIKIAAPRGQYSSPTLSIYGGVLSMTAAGTQPPTENNGTGGAVKRP